MTPDPDPWHRRRLRSGVLLVATALLAASAGFAVVDAALRDGSASPAAAASPGAPTPNEQAPRGVPIPSTGPGEALHLTIGGKVTAVSATSITLGAEGHQVKAAVTPATKVTGKTSDIQGVKAGDLVSAQITGSGGKLTATAIQDPASIP